MGGSFGDFGAGVGVRHDPELNQLMFYSVVFGLVRFSICASHPLRRRGHANLICIVPMLADDPRIPFNRLLVE